MSAARELVVDPGLPDRLMADVEALAAMPRGSATAGERAAAAWIAERLAAVGAAAVEVQPYPGRTTYGWSFAAHALLAAWGVRRGGATGAVAAAAALLGLERDAGGRSGPLRESPATGVGANVIARVDGASADAGTTAPGGAGVAAGAGPAGAAPARRGGAARPTVVLLAHHDTARTGLVWHPAARDPGWEARLRRRSIPGFLWPVAGAAASGVLAGGAAAAAPGSALVRRGAGAVRGAATGLLLLTAALNAEVAMRAPVPGANDNATGVAVLLEVARSLAAAPVPGVDVVLASCGSEESGMAGAVALFDGPLRDLDLATTLVLGIDTLGSGVPVLAASEGVLRTHRYPESALLRVRDGARRAGLDAPEGWRIGGWTDPVVAHHRGLSATCLLSVDERGAFPGYHRPTDRPGVVAPACVAACAAIARGTIEAVAAV